VEEPSPTDTDDAFWSFQGPLVNASESGDVASVKSLMDRSAGVAARFAHSFDMFVCRMSLSIACERGHLDLLAYWLDDSSLTPPLRVNDFVPCYDLVQCFGWREEGVAASLLWVAAARGQCELAQALLSRGADLEEPASDGSTPFYVACEQGHTAMLRLLSRQKVDMHSLNQDGTAPIHAAAMNGHLEAVKFLHENGVDVQTRGTIHLWQPSRGCGSKGEYLLTGVTIRMITVMPSYFSGLKTSHSQSLKHENASARACHRLNERSWLGSPTC